LKQKHKNCPLSEGGREAKLKRSLGGGWKKQTNAPVLKATPLNQEEELEAKNNITTY
jgi:hypothetical protein